MRCEISVYTESQARFLADFLANCGISRSTIQDCTGWKDKLESACYLMIDSIDYFGKEEFVELILTKIKVLWGLEMKVIVFSENIAFYHKCSSVEEHISNLGISPEEYQEIFPFKKHIENVEQKFCTFRNKFYFVPISSEDKTCPCLGCESSDKCKLNY